MKRLHPVKIDDAKYYEKIWGEEYKSRPYYDAVRMRALARDVRHGDRVLDVGAGVFGTAQYLAENNPELIIGLTCIDQSHTAKEIVDKLNLPINYVIGSVEKLPFEDKQFDVVIAGEIIEHMEDPAAFVKELCRIGNKVALSTVDTKSENAIKHGDYIEHLWEFEESDLIDFFKPFCSDVEFCYVGDYMMIYAITK